MVDIQKKFLELALEVKALLFGEFTLKSGRKVFIFSTSHHFWNPVI